MEEGGSYEVWGRLRSVGRGDGILCWVEMCMGVFYEETSVWVGRLLVKILSLRFGWGIE